MTNIIFFDTETSGLPNYKASNHDPSQPYVLQLAAILTSPSGETLDEFCTLVQPTNSNPIHPKAFEAHGISREQCQADGIPAADAFGKFMDMATQCSLSIAHNHSFDLRLLGIMSAQIDKETSGQSVTDYAMFKEIKSLCTMMSTTNYCALPYPSGRKGNKWPKLEELYFIMHRENMADKYKAHDALEDVRCTRDCFFELIERGVIKL